MALPLHSIYVHLPFCRTLCPFCAFSVLRDREEKSFYLDLLEREWWLLQDSVALDFSSLGSVYLGGGTPSTLNLHHLERLFRLLPPLGAPVQVSMELNPEDVSLGYALGLKELGVNRVSLGVQSLDPRSLQTLGRGHPVRHSLQAIENLQSAGFTDLNLDLIFGFLGQTAAELERDLEGFLALKPRHISAYALSVEPGSKIARLPVWSRWVETEEQRIRDFYLYLIEALAGAGYRQYEVSNFALPGFESRQNLSNWNRESYLGLGLSAHGLLGDFRYANHRSLRHYKEDLNQGRNPWSLSETLTVTQVREERWMLELRRPEGVRLADFFPDPALAVQSFAPAFQNGWIRLDGERLCLTVQGFLLADELTAYLLTRQTGKGFI
ncbi:MAG: hypothetical protein A2600_04635 [Candidatus Lambdaproteobacteria bacterium RIFOXYD1_FULL_56_27]|uniref:Heme chaperone HemW n=1 Tax=Candidatus Lambdaproteobacteria bacterium RIFOXYD2_FULL_56_26 TaxID=1817773 RepID=A0A1F6H3U3_9PROT|nr:MAG: hypothetical protein A2426_13700 [Candidatus Lambdaproteobacteria bacterium RIFOXYC1_FULL_56_13]OGH05041.1 MAG: hypothetical protein A2557_08700 [Candidatus Lambdaproteobacteria bacterium RIFOXYD2_FULL_56_26]OGH09506.1 MAG: hypothetical protein A2600_04635 [Candidatus Lambdaproteobacteria bacterium RIFOXYD1_FULL_56_27]